VGRRFAQRPPLVGVWRSRKIDAFIFPVLELGINEI
jgi:hypothetical protein